LKDAVIFPLFSILFTGLIVSMVGFILVNIGNEGAILFGFGIVFTIAAIAAIFKFTSKALKDNK
jgi:hypothetical protein